MPLSKIQTGVLRPLNRAAPRFSDDIDVFHDRRERVTQVALNDAAVLETAGYKVE